jgi:hypothetical protein
MKVRKTSLWVGDGWADMSSEFYSLFKGLKNEVSFFKIRIHYITDVRLFFVLLIVKEFFI